MTKRLALPGLCLAIAIVHALVAFWTPIQGDDWQHLVWHGQHPDAGLGTWLATHWTFSDALGSLLAGARWLHVILTPAVDVALVIGVFTVAMRRLPRAEWPDVLGVALVSAAIWIAQPHAGMTWFHVPSVATYVYGTAIAVWFVAPWRCGWTVPRALWPVLALAGYCVGTSSRAIASTTVVGLVCLLWALPRERRMRWMWVALGALVAGTAAGYVKTPWIEFGRVFRRGFDPNLIVMRVPIDNGGRLIALIAALAVIAVVARLPLADAGRPEPRETVKWSLAWLATSVWCLFGPHFYEATLLPATCLLVIATLPYLTWFATSRALRCVVIAFAIAVHAVVWSVSLTAYHRYGMEGARRMMLLETARPGQVAVIPPYTQILPTFWFFGEDLSTTRLRQQLSLDVFGVRDISMIPTFRRLELDPEIAVRLETDGATADQLAAARVPARWSGDPSVARDQFAQLIKRLATVTGKPVSARLVVTNVDLPQRGTRPLLLAWSDPTGTMIPRTAISPLDEENMYTVRMYDNLDRFDEAFSIVDGVAKPTPYRNAAPKLRPERPRLAVVVLCNHDRCLVEDAFVPHF